jgi:hypothetical protein
MSNRHPKDLRDLGERDADLLVIRHGCGRKGTFELWPILNIFRSRDGASCGERSLSLGAGAVAMILGVAANSSALILRRP